MTEHEHANRPALARAIGRPPQAREITVVEVRFRRGEGCCEVDPVREVVAYYAPDGQPLAENEPALAAPSTTALAGHQPHVWDTDLTDGERERLAEELRRLDYMNWPAEQVAEKLSGTVRAIASARLYGAGR